MFRSEVLKKFSTFALLVCVVVACKSIASLGSPTTLKSTDGKFEITVPGGWKDEPSLNAKAQIAAANKLAELYVIVITDNKSEFAKDMTLDKFTDITRKSMISNTAAPDSGKPTSVTVNGLDSRQYELNGTVHDVQISYLVTTVETPDSYHQVITWTLPSKYAEGKATLKQVIDSFRAVPVSGSDTNTSSSH